MADARLTQDVAELLSQPQGPHLSQAAVEVLSQPQGPHLTQAAIEVLTALTVFGGDARVSQDTVEVLTGVVPPTPAQITQSVIELLGENRTALTAVTQAVVELLSQPPPTPALVTQVAVELFVRRLISVANTQLAIELFRTGPSPLFVTQVLVELFVRLPPCTNGTFPIDDAGAGGSCVSGILP